MKLLLNGEAVADNAAVPVHYGRRGVAKKRFVLSRARTDDDDEDEDDDEGKLGYISIFLSSFYSNCIFQTP